jgi:hypothetical protein
VPAFVGPDIECTTAPNGHPLGFLGPFIPTRGAIGLGATPGAGAHYRGEYNEELHCEADRSGQRRVVHLVVLS